APALNADFGLQYPLRVLVVEDNAVNTKVILLLLAKLGYRADTACNGREALQSLSRQDYDLIIMDVQMPEMDGIEATRHLREKVPATERPYILGLSANVRKEDVEACFSAGMHDFLSKPVRLEKLTAAIARAYHWLNHPAAQAQHHAAVASRASL